MSDVVNIVNELNQHYKAAYPEGSSILSFKNKLNNVISGAETYVASGLDSMNLDSARVSAQGDDLYTRVLNTIEAIKPHAQDPVTTTEADIMNTVRTNLPEFKCIFLPEV